MFEKIGECLATDFLEVNSLGLTRIEEVWNLAKKLLGLWEGASDILQYLLKPSTVTFLADPSDETWAELDVDLKIVSY